MNNDVGMAVMRNNRTVMAAMVIITEDTHTPCTCTCTCTYIAFIKLSSLSESESLSFTVVCTLLSTHSIHTQCRYMYMYIQHVIHNTYTVYNKLGLFNQVDNHVGIGTNCS